MKTKIPLHIYVNDNGEAGGTTKYSELETTNIRTVIDFKDRIQSILDNGEVGTEYKFIIDHLKKNVANICSREQSRLLQRRRRKK